MKIKPVSLLVVPLGKALGGIPPSWCGRQMAAWQLLSELVMSLSRDRRINMQQNTEINKTKTDWQLTKLLAFICKLYLLWFSYFAFSLQTAGSINGVVFMCAN